MASLYRYCKETKNFFSSLNRSHTRCKWSERYCTKWDSQVTARRKQRTFLFLKIIDQMTANSAVYFACPKIESTKAHKTLSIKVYFQYIPSKKWMNL